ncbi:MAG TPA: hypothetical protein VFG35_18430 [Actinoplanes sp.]|nr:hypothetical protein [Actinoplanes sp.]
MAAKSAPVDPVPTREECRTPDVYFTGSRINWFRKPEDMGTSLEEAGAQTALAELQASPDDDYLTVTLLAAGLAEILHRRSRAQQGETIEEGLLPPAWRVGFSRLWWRCAEQSCPLDWDDLRLLRWCAEPFSTWPVILDLSPTDLQQTLLVDEQLSEFAEQGARLAHVDVEAEWVERQVYEALRSTAAANGTTKKEVEEAYAYLRRYLIDHTVITDRTVLSLEHNFRAKDSSGRTMVRGLIDVAYRSRPVSGPQRFLLCPGCHNVVNDLAPACHTPGCLGGNPLVSVLEPLAVVYEQHRATRLYFHDPGLVEARIIDALRDDERLAGKVRVTAYPEVDVLDVLVEFLSPGPSPVVLESWGVDAKDQVSAHLLGRGFIWPQRLPCTGRFLALPMHRARQPQYVTDLRSELDGRVSGVVVIDEQRLLKRIRERAEELHP